MHTDPQLLSLPAGQRFRTRLPGDSVLRVTMWDKDIVFDDVVGMTKIDLEDRIFSDTWMQVSAWPSG